MAHLINQYQNKSASPRWAGLVVSLILAGIYLSILPDRLTHANFGQDGGDFLAAILTRGIPHPTGYPTYTLFGQFLQLVPVGSAYTRGVLASLIPASLAGGLLTAWVTTFFERGGWLRTAAGILAGFGWGLAPLVFSQAVIVEVHGLQMFFITAALFWTALLWTYHPGQRLFSLLFWSLLTGLGMGNHITLALLLPPGLLALLTARRRGIPGRWIVSVAACTGAGLLVYLYLPLAARGFPPVNWGNPQTWEGFWWQISGAPYRQLLAPQLPLLAERLRSLAALLMHQFGLIGLAAGVVGAVQAPFTRRPLNGLLLWTFFAGTLFAALYNTSDSTAYLIPALAVFAVWIGLSLTSLVPLRLRALPVGFFLGAAVLISLAVRTPSIRAEVDPRGQDAPAVYAEAVMDQAPAGALLVTNATQDTFPIWFYHFGLGQRPDLRVIVRPLTQFAWYRQTLPHTYPDLLFPAENTADAGAGWGDALVALNVGRSLCRTEPLRAGPVPATFTCEAAR